MLTFGNPIRPGNTRIDAEGLQLIASVSSSPAEREIVPRLVASHIADVLHSQAPDLTADGLMPKDRAQAFFEALVPQIPITHDSVGPRVKTQLHAKLIGNDYV